MKYINQYEKNGIATVELNRPAKKNAWNEEMREEMRLAVRAVLSSKDTRVLIIKGQPGVFSSGEDVGEMRERRDDEWTTRDFRRMATNIHNLFDDLEAAEIPIIAAIDGTCVCGGLELALSCDFRFASERSRFGLIEGNVGFIPGSGGCSRLVKVAGVGVTKELILGGEIIDAQRAKEMNLLHRVFPAETFEQEVQAFAEKLAKKAPLTMGMAKLVINLCADSNFNTGRHFERFGQSILMQTDDHLEAVDAFLHKREPNFKAK
jgi:enoyl-CoA hydratase/carnithine racemase